MPVSNKRNATRDGSTEEDSIPLTARRILRDYLLNVEDYCKLEELRKRGWANPSGDDFFQKQRHNADNSQRPVARYFFKTMKDITKELDTATLAFEIPKTHHSPTILDICAAPGGFASYILEKNTQAKITGFSLPFNFGGHNLFAKHSNLKMKFMGITILAADMGVTKHNIPQGRPDEDNFHLRRALNDECFDLVVCDGQVLRTHDCPECREFREARRLATTQLILGLEHVKVGETMVILMHKVESWETVCTLRTFSKFSDITLFKSARCHTIRSSFYLVAKNIQPHTFEATEALTNWKKDWFVSTFGDELGFREMIKGDPCDARLILDNFGEELVLMGKQVWNTQAVALGKQSWAK